MYHCLQPLTEKDDKGREDKGFERARKQEERGRGHCSHEEESDDEDKKVAKPAWA